MFSYIPGGPDGPVRPIAPGGPGWPVIPLPPVHTRNRQDTNKHPLYVLLLNKTFNTGDDYILRATCKNTALPDKKSLKFPVVNVPFIYVATFQQHLHM
jgi:hypothetical protein